MYGKGTLSDEKASFPCSFLRAACYLKRDESLTCGTRESLTYTTGETLTCTIGETLTPFEVQHEASNRCLSKGKKREYNNFPITPKKNKIFLHRTHVIINICSMTLEYHFHIFHALLTSYFR